jgi:hypothetical protein
MAVTQKIIGGNAQPNGGQGIVSMAGANGLTAANKINANHSVSSSPPLDGTQLDRSIAVMDGSLDGRYSLKQAYDANQPSGVAIYPIG